jgi:hypothetical protein
MTGAVRSVCWAHTGNAEAVKVHDHHQSASPFGNCS